ncbi:MAG: DMT family transporter [Gammaproteobacteria bacterium]|jgi:drug/metabolite transporter (DMT)-like permease|nr:DMT family transporter [Gammaproteobacteria bacterium]
MLLLCFLWGFQQITIKIANAGVSPLMQAGIRSFIAVIALSIWMYARNIRPFQKDGTLIPGIISGLLFAIEFIFMYWGLTYTSASRAVIFVYLAPFVVALGIHWFIPNEKLNRIQVIGMILAFTGIIIAFGEGFTVLSGKEWIGDLACVFTAIFWGATTVLVRASKLISIEPSRVLYYQLLVSAVLLLPLSLLLGESGITHISPQILASLAFQGLIVAFASYLTWFWLIAHYPAARLSAYTFFTPLFGVLCGVFFLNEKFTAGVVVALVLVTIGIYLVNLKSVKLRKL